MKRLSFFLMIWFSIKAFSQTYTDNDEKYWFYEFINDSTIKAFFTEDGSTSPKTCASFYRIAQLDRHYFMFIGRVKDYYLDSTLFFEGFINRYGFYHGYTRTYYPNGKLKETGFYNNGKKEGIWNYYYKNGNPRKVIEFGKDSIRLLEFYSKKGKQMVKDGNGNFKDIIEMPTVTSLVEGEVKNGKFDGKWTFTNYIYETLDGIEYYEEGKFIKGESYGWNTELSSDMGFFDQDIDKQSFNSSIKAEKDLRKSKKIYSENPILTFDERLIQEKMNLYRYFWYCRSGTSISPPLYKDNFTLSSSFFPEFIDVLNSKINIKEIENQWCMVSFNIDENLQINKLKIKSLVVNDFLSQTIISTINSMKGWTKAGMFNDMKINYPLYFVIAFENGQLIIPEYHFKIGPDFFK